MADVTKNVLEVNAGAEVTAVAGAASQTVVYDRSDDKIILHFVNGDAEPCRVKVSAGDGMSATLGALNVDIAAGEEAAIGLLESAQFKADGKVTIEILDQDDSAFSGTVGNVEIRVFELPKALVN